ncbi:hypothetical protein FACS1894164_08240 [Spirochaetia bacterium]|nr:hypothetical protein FACS1894164_08240 [Spirochaetia bacterium]
MSKYLIFTVILLFQISCVKAEPDKNADSPDLLTPVPEILNAPVQKIPDSVALALTAAEIPENIAGTIRSSGTFVQDLATVLTGDPSLRTLVDKGHSLPDGYEPADLVELRNGVYQVGRAGLLLRMPAERAFAEMAAAARAEGVTLIASSTYRSYEYQVEVYARNVRISGQVQADRESARPGRSQHQTGLVIDFGSITDAFAETRAGKWIEANASRFGWSISFPDGYEAVTGYRWESWHYRYVGTDLTHFIDTYFAGIQHYALRFLYEWEAISI